MDRTLGWAADHLADWYGIAHPELTNDEESIAASLLWLLKGDAGQRVLIAWAFGWQDAQQASGTDWFAPWIAQLATDPYDAIRLVTRRSLQTLKDYATVDFQPLSGRAELRAAKQWIMDRWKTAGHQESRIEPQLLVDNDGRINAEQVKRLGELATLTLQTGEPFWLEGESSSWPPQLRHVLEAYQAIATQDGWPFSPCAKPSRRSLARHPRRLSVGRSGR